MASPLRQPFLSLSVTVHYALFLKQAYSTSQPFQHALTHEADHKHVAHGPLLSTNRSMTSFGFTPQHLLTSFPRLTFLVSWLASQLLVFELGNFPHEICLWPPSMEVKKKPKKEADHSRLVGGSFNKQENLYTSLVFSGNKISRSLYSSARILKVYIETLTGFSHIHCKMLSTMHCSFKVVSLKMAPTLGMVAHSLDRVGCEEPLIPLVQLEGPLNEFLQL